MRLVNGVTSSCARARLLVMQNARRRPSQSLRDVNVADISLPAGKALGIRWDTENDTLLFKIDLAGKYPVTRRGILA